MFLMRLKQFPHGPDETRVLDHLHASVQAQQDLLDALLDIAQLEADSVKTAIRVFPVAELFEPLVHGLQAQADAKNLTLRIRHSALWVMSDPALLTRILLNLAHNALRYTARGGILVACRRSKGCSAARIEVWDTGVGIAPQHQAEVFKEFFQVSNSEREPQARGWGWACRLWSAPPDCWGTRWGSGRFRVGAVASVLKCRWLRARHRLALRLA